ncbi:MAG: maltose O-acetyltransferase [Maribacter sp.]|jgi:maltose O-acetyltransferase
MKKLLRKIYNKWLRKKQKLHLLKDLGKPCYIDTSATFNFHKNISIGAYSRIGKDCHLDGEGSINIGEGTIFAPRVVILTSSHNYKDSKLLPYDETDAKRPVNIGKGCWLGWGAMIVPGVTIGDGAVVAMGAVVTKNVPNGTIVGGNPAKVLKNRTNNIDILIKEKSYFVKYKIEKQVIREGRQTDLSNNLLE